MFSQTATVEEEEEEEETMYTSKPSASTTYAFLVVFLHLCFNDVNKNRTLECWTRWCMSIIALVMQTAKFCFTFKSASISSQAWTLPVPVRGRAVVTFYVRRFGGWSGSLKVFSVFGRTRISANIILNKRPILNYQSNLYFKRNFRQILVASSVYSNSRKKNASSPSSEKAAHPD